MAEPQAPAAAEERRSGAFVSVTHDGIEVQSNTGTEADLRSELGLDDAPAAVAEPVEGEPKPRARSRHENPTTRMIEATRREAAAKRERDEAVAEGKRIKEENDALKAAATKPPSAVQPPTQPAQSQPQAAQQPVAQVAAQATDDPEPKIDDFKAESDPYTAWIFARNNWGTRQEIRKASQQTSAQWAAYHESVAWESRLEAAEKKAPGLKAKLLGATVGVDRRVMPYIRSQDYGPAVLEYLEEHKDIAQRLTTLHPVEQIGQIGEIVGMLKQRSEAASVSGSAPKPHPVSQARPPIKPPAGVAASTASDEPPGDDATDAEHDAYYRKYRKRFR